MIEQKKFCDGCEEEIEGERGVEILLRGPEGCEIGPLTIGWPSHSFDLHEACAQDILSEAAERLVPLTELSRRRKQR